MRAVQEIVMLQFHVVAFTKKVWSIRALNAKELFLSDGFLVGAS